MGVIFLRPLGVALVKGKETIVIEAGVSVVTQNSPGYHFLSHSTTQLIIKRESGEERDTPRTTASYHSFPPPHCWPGPQVPVPLSCCAVSESTSSELSEFISGTAEVGLQNLVQPISQLKETENT